MPYFSSSHFTAARKTKPLSVIISSKHPHLQMTSSKSQMPTVLAVSAFRGRPSTQLDKAHLPWTIYLHPFDFGVMCTVSACNHWKIDGVCVTVGGISTTRLVRS